jgi:preprotein translocase subunit SecD
LLTGGVLLALVLTVGCPGGPGGRTNASFVLQVDMTSQTNRAQFLAQTIKVLRERLSRTSVFRLALKPDGEERIAIDLKGVPASEDKTVRRLLVRPGLLEFRTVHPQSMDLIANKGSAPGFEPLPMKASAQAATNVLVYLVNEQPARGLTGRHVDRAWLFRDRGSGRPTIGLRFSPPGASLYREVTRENVGRRLAIVLDREVLAAPEIEEEQTVPHCTIPMRLTDREVNEILNLLQHPLPARVKIAEEGSP